MVWFTRLVGVFGIIGLFIAWSMRVDIEGVVNIGLLNSRQNILIVSCFAILLGVVVDGFCRIGRHNREEKPEIAPPYLPFRKKKAKPLPNENDDINACNYLE